MCQEDRACLGDQPDSFPSEYRAHSIYSATDHRARGVLGDSPVLLACDRDGETGPERRKGMVGGKANSRYLVSWGLGAGGWEEPDRTSSPPSDAFDFNYGVCVMRMREGLNISEVMQAHSEYTTHMLGLPVKTQNRIPESSRTRFF